MTTITTSRPATPKEMQAEIDRLHEGHALIYDELQELRGVLAREYSAWAARNAARKEFRAWLRRYETETGESFWRDEAEPEDVAAFDAMQGPAKEAQRALTSARAATRRHAKKLTPN